MSSRGWVIHTRLDSENKKTIDRLEHTCLHHKRRSVSPSKGNAMFFVWHRDLLSFLCIVHRKLHFILAFAEYNHLVSGSQNNEEANCARKKKLLCHIKTGIARHSMQDTRSRTAVASQWQTKSIEKNKEAGLFFSNDKSCSEQSSETVQSWTDWLKDMERIDVKWKGDSRVQKEEE